PQSAIWVGYQPDLKALFPKIDLELRKPEEIRIVSNDAHLAIFGRDRFDGDEQVEFGSAHAVSTFLQRHLDVRWLWPGELGRDVIHRPTIRLESIDYRYHPPFRDRTFRYPRQRTAQPVIRWWDIHHRGRGSLTSKAHHAFTDWWEKYSESHPEYFALQL